MRFAVFAPYWGADEKRERNWRIVRRQFAVWGWDVTHSDLGQDRARARNEAARSCEWDVGLFCDADILLGSRQQGEAALFRAYTTGAYTVAYSTLHYLTEEGSEAVERGFSPENAAYDESVALTWECCFAVRRDVWDEVGGFDERFVGYGHQGTAFYYAASTLAGRARITGTAFHLAHDLVDRDAEPNFLANTELCERYRAASGSSTAMRGLLGKR